MSFQLPWWHARPNNETIRNRGLQSLCNRTGESEHSLHYSLCLRILEVPKMWKAWYFCSWSALVCGLSDLPIFSKLGSSLRENKYRWDMRFTYVNILQRCCCHERGNLTKCARNRGANLVCSMQCVCANCTPRSRRWIPVFTPSCSFLWVCGLICFN